MARKARVWNDNKTTDWSEDFKGKTIKIASGKSIDMDFFDAHEFKGQYSPIRLLADETQDPKSYKTIRVEEILDAADELDSGMEIFPCNACKKIYNSQDALDLHSKEHSDRVVTDPEGEREAQRMAKRKPGRPAKVEATVTE